MPSTLTWIGHATFRIDTSGGKRIYVDPWLDGNPKAPPAEQQPERCDLVLLTHGHADHSGGAVALGKRFGCPVACVFELANWLARNGYPEDAVRGMGKGGTQQIDGIGVTLTNAFHSSSAPDGSYAGEPAGIVVTLEDGRRVYFAGDTCVFGDMQLIGRLYSPDLAVLPIGDHYTMGPREAALALELEPGVRRCVPSHYGTFPLLTGTPEALRREAPSVEVVELRPGGSTEI